MENKNFKFSLDNLSLGKINDTFDSYEYNESCNSNSTGSKIQSTDSIYQLKNSSIPVSKEQDKLLLTEKTCEDLINNLVKNVSLDIYKENETNEISCEENQTELNEDKILLNITEENQSDFKKEKSSTDTFATTFNSITISQLLNKNILESEKKRLLNEFFKNSKNLGKTKSNINYNLDKFFNGPDIYKMHSKPRGFCLIINNIDFPVHKQRKGSDLEAEYLKDIFEQLGFKILIYENQSASAILKIFKNVSERPELEKHDAFVSFISSHGDDGRVIIGSDGMRLKIDSFLSYFTNLGSPFLKDKPKLFFIQACRGSNHDFGTYDTGIVFDSIIPKKLSTRDKLENVDRLLDTLVVYSTLDGFVSIRNEITGSWFGDALGSVLRDRSCNLELQQLLCCVNRKILSREKGDVHQVIESNFLGFKKRFYFNPGHFSS